MSVVRRFFCLFVTFDLLFTVLMWLIIILVSMTLVGLVIFHIWKLIMPYLILQATQESHFVVPFFTRYKHWPECVLAGLANLFLHLTSLNPLIFLRSTLILSFHLCLGLLDVLFPLVFLIQIFYAFSPVVLHILLISSSLI